MSNRDLLKELLKKILDEKLTYLENKSKEDMSSLSYTKSEFDILEKKIDTWVQQVEEKNKKEKHEEEKKEEKKEKKEEKKDKKEEKKEEKKEKKEEKKDKKEEKKIIEKNQKEIKKKQPLLSRNSIGLKISPSTSNFHKTTTKVKENNNINNTTNDFGRKTLTTTKSLGNIFTERKSIGGNTERMSIRQSISRNTSFGRKTITGNILNNKNDISGRKSIKSHTIGKKGSIKGKTNNKKVNHNSITNTSVIKRNDDSKICFNRLIEEDIVNSDIIPYLNDNEKLVFYSINKKLYLKTLIEALNNRISFYNKIFGLLIGQTYDSKLSMLEKKYKPEELNIEVPPFNLGRGTIKALELLDQESYLKVFLKPPEENKLNEIIIVYKIFCQLLKKEDLLYISDNREFWEKFSKYVIDNKTDTLSKFFIDSSSKFHLDNVNLNKVRKLAINQLDKINPSYYGKICGTTGLVVFLIKEMLIYVGIIEDKKTSPAKIKENLIYQKKVIEKLTEYYELVKKME